MEQLSVASEDDCDPTVQVPVPVACALGVQTGATMANTPASGNTQSVQMSDAPTRLANPLRVASDRLPFRPLGSLACEPAL
jgi:hypothetical protein